MYGKIDSVGRFIQAPNNFKYQSKTYVNPSSDVVTDMGYSDYMKVVDANDNPKDKTNYEPYYTVEGDVIVRRYRLKPICLTTDNYQQYLGGGSNLVGRAKETVADITYGWNLGNTFEATVTLTSSDPQALTRINTDDECPYYETCWGEIRPTEEMFDLLKADGFNIVRVPITWAHHVFDDDDYTISEKWLARLKEVVGWILDRDMYCIINTHHDDARYGEKVGQGYFLVTGWLHCNPSTIETVGAKFKKLWTNIANEFKDYGDHLIFEGFNELQTSKRNWMPATLEEYRALNILNQYFIDAVRDTGGNNATRTLCCQTYMSHCNNNEYIEPPVDTIDNGIIWQIHDYQIPFDQYLDLSGCQYFIDNDMPLIVGEFGTTNTSMAQELRVKHIQNFVARYKALGIKCIWWDDSNFTLMDRPNATWVDPNMINGLKLGSRGIAVDTEYRIEQEMNDSSYYTFNALSTSQATLGQVVHYLAEKGSFVNKDAIDISNDSYISVNITGEGWRLYAIGLYDENDNCLSCVSARGAESYFAPTNGAAKLRFCYYCPWGWRSLNIAQEDFENGNLGVVVRTF